MLKSFRKRARSASVVKSSPVEREHRVETLESRLLMAVFTVTNTNDTGAGSLRDALTRSNNTAGVDTIAFNLPASGAKVIRPASALPELWDPAVLDGTTQPGYAGKPLVQIDGGNAGAGATGLKLWGGSTAKGLSVTSFAVDGVDLNNRGGFAGNVLQGMWVGVDLAGNAAGNGGQGVLVWKSANNLIGGPDAADRNVISAAKTKGTLGVFIMGSTATGNVVQNNYVGTDPTGTQARANAGSGIGIQDAPNNKVLGNLISGNAEDGILIYKSLATGNVIQGNRVGVDATGAKALANGFYGIEIQTANNTIGGTTPAERNVFSGNLKAGVVLWTTAATANTIQGNYIGTDATGSAKVGNVQQGIAVSNAGGNTIKGNLISGNTLEGVGIFPGSNNTVTGNTIGFAASGGTLANGTWAVTLVGGSNGNVVTGNYIAPHPSATFQNSGSNTTTPNLSSAPIAADVTGARVTSAAFVYDGGPQQLRFRFSEDVSASLSAGDLIVVDSATSASFAASGVTYDRSSNTAVFTFATPLPRGTYAARLASAGVSDAAGNRLDGDGNALVGGDYVYRFFHLPGDANRDGVVNFSDLALLSQNYNKSGKVWSQGDFNGDRVVNFSDLAILSQNYNASVAVPFATEAISAPEPSESSLLASSSDVVI